MQGGEHDDCIERAIGERQPRTIAQQVGDRLSLAESSLGRAKDEPARVDVQVVATGVSEREAGGGDLRRAVATELQDARLGAASQAFLEPAIEEVYAVQVVGSVVPRRITLGPIDGERVGGRHQTYSSCSVSQSTITEGYTPRPTIP